MTTAAASTNLTKENPQSLDSSAVFLTLWMFKNLYYCTNFIKKKKSLLVELLLPYK